MLGKTLTNNPTVVIKSGFDNRLATGYFSIQSFGLADCEKDSFGYSLQLHQGAELFILDPFYCDYICALTFNSDAYYLICSCNLILLKYFD